MRPPALAVALAALCVLAGCNAFVPGSPEGGELPPVTPADVPRTGPDELAPGLTDDRLTNVSALFGAHQRVLANRSVRVEQRTTIRAGNGSVQNGQTIEYRFGADRSRVAVDATSPLYDSTNVSLWSNESATLIYRDDPAGTRYDVIEQYNGYTPTSVFARTFRGNREVDVRPVTTERLGTDDGVEVFRVRIDWGASGTTVLTVDERGLIRRAVERNITVPVSSDGYGPDTTARRVTTLAVDTGPLERPAWVVDARETIANREYVAPGVTTERVVDAYALTNAHRTLVDDRSLTTVTERWTNASNGSVLRYDRSAVRVSANRTERRAVTERRGDGPTRRTDGWNNRSVGYRQVVVGDETRYDRVGSGDQLAELELTRLQDSNTTITPLDDGRYRLVVEGDAATTGRAMIENGVTNPRLVVVFDDRGFVSRTTRTYGIESDGEKRAITQTTRYTRLGNTTVEKPDWLDAAVNATA